MTTDELVAAVITRSTGENSTATFGDDDYSKVLVLTNPKIDAWAKEYAWNSLYDPGVNCGTISATDSFDLDDSIRVISREDGDFVQIVKTDGNISNYQTVEAQDLKNYPNGNYCAKVGQTLRFNNAFTADSPEYGGMLKVPAYLYADHLAKANDTVPVDDPNWLVAATCADWVQTDYVQAQNRNDFLAEAQDLMNSMKQANAAQHRQINMQPVTTNNRDW